MVVVTTTVEATTERKRVTLTACMPIAVAMSTSASVALGSMQAAARMSATSPDERKDVAFAEEPQDEAREHDPDAEGAEGHATLQGDIPMAAGERKAGKHGIARHVGGKDAAVHVTDRVGEAGGGAEETRDPDIVREHKPPLPGKRTKSRPPHGVHFEPPFATTKRQEMNRLPRKAFAG